MPYPFTAACKAVAALLATAALALPCLPAHAAKAHSHGAAELNVSIEDHSLVIALDSPLDNLLGFEHAPAGAEQTARVRAMAQRLRNAAALFIPSREAGCSVSEVHLSSSVIPYTLLGETAATPQTHPEEAGHADLDAEFRFTCAHPAALRRIDVALFAAFARLHTLNVQLISATTQHAARLTPQAATLTW